MSETTTDRPLSATERDQAMALLDGVAPGHSWFAIGMFAAAATAPGEVAPMRFVDRIVDGDLLADEGLAAERLALVVRLYNQVVRDLEGGRAPVPDPEDAQAIGAFASGYVSGAAVDPSFLRVPELHTAVDYVRRASAFEPGSPFGPPKDMPATARSEVAAYLDEIVLGAYRVGRKS
ncbi:MAG: hypothetical protein U0230_26680 [Polyangiales bacterium]